MPCMYEDAIKIPIGVRCAECHGIFRDQDAFVDHLPKCEGCGEALESDPYGCVDCGAPGCDACFSGGRCGSCDCDYMAREYGDD